MGYTHFDKISGENGIGVGAKGSEIVVADASGNLYQAGTAINATAAEINQVADVSAQGVVRLIKIPISAAPDGTEQDTGVDLPANSIVLDAWVEVTTAEATAGTKTLHVGLLSGESGGDTDGFLAGVSVAAAGRVVGKVTTTAGANETYISGSTRGALLETRVNGSDAAGDTGFAYPHPHPVATARSVVYQSAAAFTEFRGNIFILIAQLG